MDGNALAAELGRYAAIHFYDTTDMLFRTSSPPSADRLIGLGDKTPFLRRLAETIEWCESRSREGGPSTMFRTPDQRPRTLAPSRIDVVTDVFLGRPVVDRPVTATDDLREGRLLAYFPDAELADGAAEDESSGFLDVCDGPPWDTWVALFDDGHETSVHSVYLIAWIPAQFVPLVEKGIQVNMMGSIAWLSTTDTAVAVALRRSGFKL